MIDFFCNLDNTGPVFVNTNLGYNQSYSSGNTTDKELFPMVNEVNFYGTYQSQPQPPLTPTTQAQYGMIFFVRDQYQAIHIYLR